MYIIASLFACTSLSMDTGQDVAQNSVAESSVHAVTALRYSNKIIQLDHQIQRYEKLKLSALERLSLLKQEQSVLKQKKRSEKRYNSDGDTDSDSSDDEIYILNDSISLVQELNDLKKALRYLREQRNLAFVFRLSVHHSSVAAEKK